MRAGTGGGWYRIVISITAALRCATTDRSWCYCTVRTAPPALNSETTAAPLLPLMGLFREIPCSLQLAVRYSKHNMRAYLDTCTWVLGDTDGDADGGTVGTQQTSRRPDHGAPMLAD